METLDDYFLLNARLGFLDRCFDQKYLKEELLSVLAAMQMGQIPVPPVISVDWEEATKERPPFPDWNIFRDEGISDEDFPIFRKNMLAQIDDEYEDELEL